jgi:protein arginine N-methyltransferase 2|tara:strand:- start:9094 stop:9654 length:561 start_codon:yes stop_codon:yes gene_type:complete
MSYIEQTLTFESNQIHYTKGGIKWEVMMDWEDPLMSASAAYVCEGGGDILEIGFGMGISADYIHSHSIDSHTIIENHPDIIPKAQEWAREKSNVTIITGSWYDVKDSLSTYDGIFYDTFGDTSMNHFSSSLNNLTKPGTKVTWWNNNPNQNNLYNIPDITYNIIRVSPPQNSYFNSDIYYLPKKEF